MFPDESLKEIRNKKNLTQQKIADQIGVTRVAYTNIENGTRRPSPQVAKRIAEVFGFENEWYKLLDPIEPA